MFNHFGIAVRDLADATLFFERVFGLTLIQSRTVSHEYLGTLVGFPNAVASINLLKIDEGSLLEIICWETNTFQSHSNHNIVSIWDVGAQHLCLNTKDVENLYEALKAEDVEFMSGAPVDILEGPNQGAKVFFIKAFGFLFIEIFQKP